MSVYDEIRDKLPLTQVVSQYTKLLPVDAAAGKYKGRCPLHNEKTPSFYVDDGLGVFYCFGCKKGGSVIDFIHEHDGIPITEIPVYVRDVYGLELSGVGDTETKSKRTKQLKVLEAFVNKFNIPTGRAIALQYLKKRIPNITEDVLRRYAIFYVPSGQLVAEFIDTLSEDEADIASELRLIYTKRSKRPILPFVNRVIFPIRTYGPVIALNGRAIDNNSPKKYLLTNFNKKQYVWGLKEAIKLAKDNNISYVYAVEGVIDALALATNGIPAVAYLGSSISKEQMRVLQAAFTHLVLVPDGDKAGQRGAHESIRNAIFSQFPISGEVIKLPKGEDVASFLQTRTVDDLNSLPVRTFEDYYIDFYVRTARKNVPTKTAESIRAAFLSAILPNLFDYETNPMSSAILMRIAERLAVNPTYLQLRINEGVNEAKKNIRKKLSTTKEPASMSLKITSGELRLLGSLKVAPKLLERLSSKHWYMQLSIYFRDIAEAFYESELTKQPLLSILDNKLKTTEAPIRDEYFKVLSLIPSMKNTKSAEETFNEYVALFDVRYSTNNRARKLLALANAVAEITEPITKKEKDRLVRKLNKQNNRKPESSRTLDKPEFPNVI